MTCCAGRYAKIPLSTRSWLSGVFFPERWIFLPVSKLTAKSGNNTFSHRIQDQLREACDFLVHFMLRQEGRSR